MCNTLLVHLCGCKWKNFYFYDWAVFHCAHTHTYMFSSVTQSCPTLCERHGARPWAAATVHKRGREELPHVWGQGKKPGGPHAQGVAAKRSYPTSKVRGGGQECQAATTQEQPRGPTPCPRSCGCTGAGGPRGATSRSRSGGAGVRRYCLSKVRSSGCALLEQPLMNESKECLEVVKTSLDLLP